MKIIFSKHAERKIKERCKDIEKEIKKKEVRRWVKIK